MIGLRLSWFALEAVFVCLFLYTGSGVPLAAACGLCVVVLCAIPVNLLVRKKLRLSLELPVNIGKGKTGTAVLVMENPTYFPVLCVGCRIRMENRLNGDIKTIRVNTFALPKRKSRLELKIGSDCCGRLRVTVDRVWLCDCFGVIPVSCKQVQEKSTTVQPNTFEQTIRLGWSTNRAEDSEQYSQERPGSDLTETFQVREYVEGDSPRQIHWKLSSKLDRLIVRDPALPVMRSILVFWERTGDTGSRELIDAQAEVVATVCLTLAQQEIVYTVGWNEPEQNRCVLQKVSDMDEFVGMIPRMMSARGAKDATPGAELLETLADADYSHIVYIGENISGSVCRLQNLGYVTILACGTQAPAEAVMFDASNYENQLSELEV